MLGLEALVDFLEKGGVALWLIAALSILTVAIGLWRLTELAFLGIWRQQTEAEARTPNARIDTATRAILADADFDQEMALREISRLARAELFEIRRGVRPLELIAAIAPLVGLLGTVLGMIEAFQSLQTAGSGADPSVLAGGIWEALLTTAAGMAVAIPASILASWFDGIAEREQIRMDDAATRAFNDAAKKERPIALTAA